MDPGPHVAAFEAATGIKVKNRDAFMTAFKGLVSCCGDYEESEPEDDEPTKPSGKGVSIAVALGKPMKKGE